MVSRRAFYERVNAAWPPQIPTLTFPEAKRAAKRLFRFAKVGWPGKVEETTGNRHTWVRGGVLFLNITGHHGGWHGLVHLLSHYFHYRRSHEGAHSKTHARMELRLVKEVVKRGWLDGRLKDKPKVEKAAPPPSAKLDHAVRMLAKALTRQKRATTIAKKWARRVTRLQKAPKQPPRQDREDHGDQAA